MKCPTCKLINPDTALRCDCGYNFQNGRMEQPYQDAKTPVAAGITYCARCKAQNNASAAFCQSCGAQFLATTAEPARPANKPVSTAAVIFIGIFGCLIFSWISSLFQGDKTTQTAGTTPTPYTSKDSSDYEKVVYNELGKMRINGRSGELTSVRLDATSQDQKESLRAMLLYLEVSDLTAQRACSLTLSFGGWKDRGEIHNFSGDSIGNLNSDAVGFMRDKVNAALQGKSK